MAMFSFFGKKYRDFETNLAEGITRFAGSMTFVYIHVVWFAFWILFSEAIGDPFPYGLLTMIVSLEAIFLATFIMVAQNRQAEIAEEREEEDEAEQEEIQEDIEDIQEDFDALQKDVAEVRRLIERIEARAGQANEAAQAYKSVPLDLKKSKKKEKVSV